jgi:hypothetical protein
MTSATHQTKANRDGLRKRPLISLVSGAIVVGALIAGCGGSLSAGAARESSVTQTRAQFVGYAACMRSHGVAGYPDPQVSASGSEISVRISPGNANPNSPGFRSADRGCHHLLPNRGMQGGPGSGGAAQQAQDVVFADCIRSHGVPGFPDPATTGCSCCPPRSTSKPPHSSTRCTPARRRSQARSRSTRLREATPRAQLTRSAARALRGGRAGFGQTGPAGRGAAADVRLEVLPSSNGHATRAPQEPT